MDVETLAQLLHEAGREAVLKNLIVRTDVPTKGFIEWPDLTEEAREGRRVQARFLLDRFDIAPKVLVPESEPLCPSCQSDLEWAGDWGVNGETKGAMFRCLNKKCTSSQRFHTRPGSNDLVEGYP